MHKKDLAFHGKTLDPILKAMRSMEGFSAGGDRIRFGVLEKSSSFIERGRGQIGRRCSSLEKKISGPGGRGVGDQTMGQR